MPRLFEPAWPNPQIRPQHVPPVFPAVRERHRLHQVGLNVYGSCFNNCHFTGLWI